MDVLQVIDQMIEEQQLASLDPKFIGDPDDRTTEIDKVLYLNNAFYDALLEAARERIKPYEKSPFVQVQTKSIIDSSWLHYTGPTGYTIHVKRGPYKTKWTTLFYEKVIALLKSTNQ